MISNISSNSASIQGQDSSSLTGRGTDPLRGLEERVKQTLSMIDANPNSAAASTAAPTTPAISPIELAQALGPNQNVPGQNVFGIY